MSQRQPVGSFPDDREATPGPSVQARRAAASAMSGNGDEGGRLATFDGTGNYAVWRRSMQIEAMCTEDEKKLCVKVLRALRDTPQELAVADVTRPYEKLEQILAKLDPQYKTGAGASKQDAMRMLSRCRQGSRSLTEYLAEVGALSATARVGAETTIAMVQAGISGRLAGAAAMAPMDSFPDFCAMLHRVDAMTPKNTGPPQKGGKKDGIKGRQTQTRDPSQITCYLCQKKGHKKDQCPGLGKKEKAGAKKAETANPAADDDIVEYQGNE